VQGRDGANARRAVTLGMGYLPFGSCREEARRQSSPVAGGVMGEWVRENAHWQRQRLEKSLRGLWMGGEGPDAHMHGMGATGVAWGGGMGRSGAFTGVCGGR